MKVTTKNKDKAEVEAVIALTPEDMEKYLESSANRLGKNIKVKGFREGKVPRPVVEKELGKDAVWDEALPEAVEKSFWDVVEKNNIDVIGKPSISVTKSVPGDALEFKAVIPVMPELDLPDYRKIAKKVFENEGKEVKIEDKEIEEALKWLQKSRTQTSENHEDDEKDPKDLPEINDEFAKSLGDFENLEALKENIREGLKGEKESQEKQRLRLLALEEIEKKTDLPIPDTLVEEELNKMEEELSQQVAQMGMNMDQYLKQAKKDLNEVREGWRDKAKERVAAGIILRAIAEKEDISPTEEEVQAEANKHLMRFHSAEEAEKHIDPERLRAYVHGIIRNEKVFELLEGKEKEDK